MTIQKKKKNAIPHSESVFQDREQDCLFIISPADGQLCLHMLQEV